MKYSKKGWDIVADLIRLVGTDGGLFCDIETDIFHLDIATIMDFILIAKNTPISKRSESGR